MTENVAEQFGPYLSTVKCPNINSAVFKDECVYSFDTPETDTGLYISLTTFLGFGRQHVDGYARHTGNAVYLHIRRERHEVPGAAAAADDAAATEGPEKKITRLAIGVEGGFDPDAAKAKYTYEDHHAVCIISGDAAAAHITVAYPCDELPPAIVASVKAVLAAESAATRSAKEVTAGTWDGEARLNSIYAENLQQLDNGKTIPPSGWQCERCELTSNLWLNLTDGSVLCGRRFFDGSGGNEHAVEHYKEVKYPLAVKLGTITADGKADVFSYAEDDMVLDPFLVQHLAHFGIKTAQLQKTEKSMVELELALNERIGEWSILTESASQLEPLAGPGYTGMRNLGNSCYLNSVMQVLFSVDDFVERFYTRADQFFGKYVEEPSTDFNVQMAKLAVGLCSGKYSVVAENSLEADAAGIAPVMFKHLIGLRHVEFASKQQQDAQEFFLYLIQMLEQNTQLAADNPAMAFRFTVEDRFECGDSGQVKYTQRDEFCLPLPIPLQVASNLDEVKAYEARLAEAEAKGERLPGDSLVRPKLTLNDCLTAFAQTESVEQFYSTAINGKTTAKKATRFGTLPKYLVLQLKKFTLRSDWTSVKLDVSVDIPDELDLTHFRGAGLQPGEQLLPELTAEVPPPAMDPAVLEQLVEMGFNIESCRRAVFFTQNTGAEAATQWLMEHITDSDFNDTFVPPGTKVSGAAAAKFVADAASVEQLMAMGFGEGQVKLALKETANNVERAMEYIFANQSQLELMEASGICLDDEVQMQQDETAASPVAQFDHKGAKYRLKAFISHMGTSSQVGHYVCHIQRDGKWVIFNDGKVAISQNPPKELGYLYMYESI